MFMAGFIERAPAFVKSFLQAFCPFRNCQLRRPPAPLCDSLWGEISRTRAGSGRFARRSASDLGLIPLLPVPFGPDALDILEVSTRRFFCLQFGLKMFAFSVS